MKPSPTARILPCLLVAWYCGCAAPGSGTRELLDLNTGATLQVVDEPLVMARERRDVAVQARDYLTVVGAELNVSGRRKLFLVVHEWSTIDSRTTVQLPHGSSVLLLVADGRDLRLEPAADQVSDSFSDGTALFRPEDAFVTTTMYGIDAATLDYLATSTTLTAAYPDSFALPFALWRDGRPALGRLLGAIH